MRVLLVFFYEFSVAFHIREVRVTYLSFLWQLWFAVGAPAPVVLFLIARFRVVYGVKGAYCPVIAHTAPTGEDAVRF